MDKGIDSIRHWQSKVDDLALQIRKCQLELDELRGNLKPQIDHLKSEVDELAGEFRVLFANASEAYDNDEKALAKSLSQQGRAKQSQCQELNDIITQKAVKVSAMKTDLRKLR